MGCEGPFPDLCTAVSAAPDAKRVRRRQGVLPTLDNDCAPDDK